VIEQDWLAGNQYNVSRTGIDTHLRHGTLELASPNPICIWGSTNRFVIMDTLLYVDEKLLENNAKIVHSLNKVMNKFGKSMTLSSKNNFIILISSLFGQNIHVYTCTYINV